MSNISYPSIQSNSIVFRIQNTTPGSVIWEPVYNERGREFDFTFMYWGHVAMKTTRVDSRIFRFGVYT